MKRLLPVLRVAWFPALVVTTAWAVERFPPPEFESGHKLPLTTTPPARALFLEYLDVVVLVLALGVAAYLVHRRHSRRGLFWLGLFSLAYFGFYRKGCVCAIGSIQNVALALADRGYAIPVTVIVFFVLPLLFALLFGRVFCAAVCPQGAVQDLVVLRPVDVPRWLDQALSVFPYVYLGAAALFAADGGAFIICKYDPFIGFFRRTGSAGMLVLGAAVLLVGVFVGRPYCRYVCPYGALLNLASRLAWRRVTIYPDECVKCRLCEDSCPYGAIREPTPEFQVFDRRRERRWFLTFLALTPVFTAYFAWLGSRVAVPLSRSNPTVRLAERVWLEQTGQVTGTTDASDNFRDSGTPPARLFQEADRLSRRFSHGGWWWGGFVGLVLALKLVGATAHRTRTEYEADRGACVSCGRCFPYCPAMHVRLEALRQLEGESPSFRADS